MSAIDTTDIQDAARDRDTLLENFVAELTRAVYPIVLRRGPRESWLEVELGLWRALAEAVENWAREPPPADADRLDAWRESLLVDLTVSALHVAMVSGIEAPLLELERGLSTAIRQVIGRCGHVG